MKDDGAAPLVPHSYVSADLVAHVMYGKFINALPYYRQEKDFENQFGVKIGRGTMAHWTIYCAENYFSPMIGYFHNLMCGYSVPVMTNEIPSSFISIIQPEIAMLLRSSFRDQRREPTLM